MKKHFVLLICFTQFCFSQNVALNTNFGDNGYVINSFVYGYKTLEILPNQKILGGSFKRTSTSGIILVHIALLQFNEDGSPDTTFGNDGVVITQIENTSFINSMCIQPDGKIIICGDYDDTNFVTNGLIARYNPDGSLDSSFGIDGIVKMNTDNYNFYSAGSVRLTADNKIIVAGDTGSQTFIARFNSDGSIDTTFSTNGVKICNTPDFQFVVEADQLVVLPDGAMLLDGRDYTQSNNPRMAVVKYNADGSICNTFGNEGILLFDFNIDNINPQLEYFYNIKITNDNKIMLSGKVQNTEEFYLIKLTSNGALDFNFGNNGIINNNKGRYVFQNNGKIIYLKNIPNATNDFSRLGRLNQDGSDDLTFNGTGFFDLNPTEYTDGFGILRFQSNGNLIMSGGAISPLPRQIILTSVLIDDSLSNEQKEVSASKYVVYPNPSNGSFKINSSKLTNGKIELFDMLGQKIVQQEHINNNQTIQTNLGKGIYLLKITTDENTVISQKIIVE